MVRRGKDLFELLQMRERGGGGGGSRRRGSAEGESPLASARAWVEGLLPARKKGGRKGRRRSSNTSAPGIRLPGVALAALLLVCAGVGFAVGRVTAGIDAGAPLDAGPRVQKPEPFPKTVWQAHAELSPQKEVETLSDHFYVVVHFPASQRDQASALAGYLREQGLVDTRLKLIPSRSGDRWAVLLYVRDLSESETLLGQLRAVESPSFLPQFAELVQKPRKLRTQQ